MRLRILVGTIGLVLGLALYAALLAVLAAPLWPRATLPAMACYAAAGMIWIWPAARLTRWMNEAPPHRPPPGASP